MTLPIKIPYPVLRQLLEIRLIGMEIGSGKRKRGKIIALDLEASPSPEYDILLELQIGVAKKLFLPKELSVFIHGSLDYDPETGRLFVGTFKIASKNRNFLFDKALEFLANRVYYRKVLDKAEIQVTEIIAPRLKRLNEKLEMGIPTAQGMVFHGAMDKVVIARIETASEYISVYVLFEGAAEVILQYVPDKNVT
ncbi:MAG TPA: DUF4403 family protein [Pricia sp.]|nr:DUF4403 family protein [Pricia sp.]